MLRWCLLGCFLFPNLAISQSKGAKLPEGCKVEKNLSYGPHERNKLDLYLPKATQALPLVIFVHGGGWEGGSKEGTAAAALTFEGFAVASINYRLSKQAVFPAQIEDCREAVRFLRDRAKQYNLDPNKFGAMGTSAGGHLVSLLGTAKDVAELDGKTSKKEIRCDVQCVVDFYGPTDLSKLSPGFAPANPVTRLLGGSTTEKKDLAKLANPITHISKDDPPFLIIHGDKDPLVPVNQSELLADGLKQAKLDCTLVVVPGAGHGRGCHTEATQKQVAEFFAKHLKK